VAAIPYLGTTLPPISTMVKYFGPQSDPSQEVTVPFAGKTLMVNRVLAANVRQLGAALAAAGFTSYIRDVGGFRTSIGGSGSPIPFSMHQFGAAFDINEDGGPNGNWQTMTLPPGHRQYLRVLPLVLRRVLVGGLTRRGPLPVHRG